MVAGNMEDPTTDATVMECLSSLPGPQQYVLGLACTLATSATCRTPGVLHCCVGVVFFFPENTGSGPTYLNLTGAVCHTESAPALLRLKGSVGELVLSGFAEDFDGVVALLSLLIRQTSDTLSEIETRLWQGFQIVAARPRTPDAVYPSAGGLLLSAALYPTDTALVASTPRCVTLLESEEKLRNTALPDYVRAVFACESQAGKILRLLILRHHVIFYVPQDASPPKELPLTCVTQIELSPDAQTLRLTRDNGACVALQNSFRDIRTVLPVLRVAWLEALQSATLIPMPLLKQLIKGFEALDTDHSGRLDFDEFVRAYAVLCGDKLVHGLYEAFYEAGDLIPLRPYLESMRVLLLGSFEERAAFMCRVYGMDPADTTARYPTAGCVAVMRALQRVSPSAELPLSRPHELLGLFDPEGKGDLSSAELLNVLHTHPAFEAWRATCACPQRLVSGMLQKSVLPGDPNWTMLVQALTGLCSLTADELDPESDVEGCVSGLKKRLSSTSLSASVCLSPEVSKPNVFTCAEGGTEFTMWALCPEEFACFRSALGWTRATYLQSLGAENLIHNFFMGKMPHNVTTTANSGEMFFGSPDGTLVLKTIKRSEAAMLVAMLPAYINHVLRHPDTLIVHFLGLYQLCVGDAESFMIVMTSVFAGDAASYIKEVYDLKGSTHGRTTPPAKRTGPLAAKKDLDLQHLLMLQDLQQHALLLRQLTVDSAFLMQQGLMDYSLLVGIADHDATPAVAAHLPDSLRTPFRRGLPSANGRDTFVCGMIDILTYYDLCRTAEQAVKSVVQAGASCVPPPEYADRLCTFLAAKFQTAESLRAHDGDPLAGDSVISRIAHCFKKAIAYTDHTATLAHEDEYAFVSRLKLTFTTTVSFQSYAPHVFRRLRDAAGICNDAYTKSWEFSSSDVTMAEGAGRSGALFLHATDSRCLVKTIPDSEAYTLLTLLPQYEQHLQLHPASLLTRFCALCYISGRDFLKTWLVVMQNVTRGRACGRLYDLKGRAPKRALEPRSGDFVRKDKDLDRVFALAPADRERLLGQLERDVEFCVSHNLMDYSLFIAVEPLAPGTPAPEPHPNMFLSDDRTEAFHIGVIDVLTEYNVKKQAAHFFKSFMWTDDQLSTVQPRFYADRFCSYLRDIIPAADTPNAGPIAAPAPFPGACAGPVAPEAGPGIESRPMVQPSPPGSDGVGGELPQGDWASGARNVQLRRVLFAELRADNGEWRQAQVAVEDGASYSNVDGRFVKVEGPQVADVC